MSPRRSEPTRLALHIVESMHTEGGVRIVSHVDAGGVTRIAVCLPPLAVLAAREAEAQRQQAGRDERGDADGAEDAVGAVETERRAADAHQRDPR